jgi:hypothetical protein
MRTSTKGGCGTIQLWAVVDDSLNILEKDSSKYFLLPQYRRAATLSREAELWPEGRHHSGGT